MKDTILLTGASGFLGSRIARLLLADTDCEIYAIVRGSTQEEAESRIARLWADWPEAAEEIGRRVRVVRGDLGSPRLGLSEEHCGRIVATVTHIIHSAAELNLDGPIDALRAINVEGTARLLDLARAAHRDHGIARFSHVSTAYVAGGRAGDVSEEDLSDEYGFSNTYEQTKYEGERLVRAAMADLPVSVYRPGMVVGDSESGEIQTFNTVYVPLRLYLSGKLRLIPAKPDMPLNLIPVDYVARAIVSLTFHPEATGRTFHLTVDTRFLPTAREVLELSRRWAEEHLAQELPAARFVPYERLAALIEKKIVSVPSCLLTYFNENRRYQRENVDRLLGPYQPEWQAILPRLLSYAIARGFLRRTGRTVHEQVMARLRSRRLPLRVHDLAGGGCPASRSADEMYREVRTVKRSLEILGVRPRDRVALVGHNSSRFLSLDLAVGLMGAVSVPLYYTAPPAEIQAILRDSGARLLFVGAQELLAALDAAGLDATLISFCREVVTSNQQTGTLSWESFLALAGQSAPAHAEAAARRPQIPESFRAPVGLAETATIRFTSGTTGEPKGVTFTHSQLKWLAETVVSILPWRARIAPGRYLSFLPMNHVVEGILGAYAPAFMPAPVDVYFLDNIHALPGALKRVRPTVFFSVPRFYEKLWQRFEQSVAGGLYRALGDGTLRRIIRPAVRRALLWTAGLDKCLQLIVGSASCPDHLLKSFHDLGIELHNAYGLTEAPLVTINRFGGNRIGTVGTPLPQTELRLAPDREILVRGPQVMAGVWQGTTGDRGEWFATGDLGSIDSEGNLTIEGRKKDILVTSYGKNIQASKIEAMLRGIPGVVEAVVIGENRPAVCALLWLAGGSAGSDELFALDRAVETMNLRLSNPEKLKRWAVLTEKPSIENEELTGNLKVRRTVVTAHRAPVATLLYEDMAGPDATTNAECRKLGIIHLGRRLRKCA